MNEWDPLFKEKETEAHKVSNVSKIKHMAESSRDSIQVCQTPRAPVLSDMSTACFLSKSFQVSCYHCQTWGLNTFLCKVRTLLCKAFSYSFPQMQAQEALWKRRLSWPPKIRVPAALWLGMPATLQIWNEIWLTLLEASENIFHTCSRTDSLWTFKLFFIQFYKEKQGEKSHWTVNTAVPDGPMSTVGGAISNTYLEFCLFPGNVVKTTNLL